MRYSKLFLFGQIVWILSTSLLGGCGKDLRIKSIERRINALEDRVTSLERNKKNNKARPSEAGSKHDSPQDIKARESVHETFSMESDTTFVTDTSLPDTPMPRPGGNMGQPSLTWGRFGVGKPRITAGSSDSEAADLMGGGQASRVFGSSEAKSHRREDSLVSMQSSFKNLFHQLNLSRTHPHQSSTADSEGFAGREMFKHSVAGMVFRKESNVSDSNAVRLVESDTAKDDPNHLRNEIWSEVEGILDGYSKQLDNNQGKLLDIIDSLYDGWNDLESFTNCLDERLDLLNNLVKGISNDLAGTLDRINETERLKNEINNIKEYNKTLNNEIEKQSGELTTIDKKVSDLLEQVDEYKRAGDEARATSAEKLENMFVNGIEKINGKIEDKISSILKSVNEETIKLNSKLISGFEQRIDTLEKLLNSVTEKIKQETSGSVGKQARNPQQLKQAQAAAGPNCEEEVGQLRQDVTALKNLASDLQNRSKATVQDLRKGINELKGDITRLQNILSGLVNSGLSMEKTLSLPAGGSVTYTSEDTEDTEDADGPSRKNEDTGGKNGKN